jgi:U3 small nucleolar RNA-associated protein 7
MNALIVKGNSVAPLKRKRGSSGVRDSSKGGLSSSKTASNSKASKGASSFKPKSSEAKKQNEDKTLLSVAASALPPATGPASKSSTNRHIKDLKLRSHLNYLEAHAKESRELAKDTSELLLNATSADAGLMVAEDPMERTWRVGQDEILQNVGEAVASQRKEWVLDGGPYRCRYTRNGRSGSVLWDFGRRGLPLILVFFRLLNLLDIWR